MEAESFDRLARALSLGGSRRRLVTVLAAVPLAGLLATLLTEESEAGGRQKRRKKRNKRQSGDDKKNRKGQHTGQGKRQHRDRRKQPGTPAREPVATPPGCTPDSAAQTCAGTCGRVPNNCGTPVECGPCTCATGCPPCQRCHPDTGVCVPVDNDTPCDDGNACTRTDSCQNGVCVGSNPVLCPPPRDQCLDAGTCDPGTGACSYPNKANDTPCDDGNACMQTDTCQRGVCVGSDPVSCTPPDQCKTADCDPATGQCTVGNKPNGTTCDDGNACTEHDTCQDGTCAGTPIVCTASGQCHDVGTCNPATGQCSNPAKTDGTACDDGNACTQTDTCQGGVCVGSDPVTCTALDQCHVAGICDPASGTCSSPAKTDGTACDDGDACTQTDTCQGGICIGTPVCGPCQSCSGGICTNVADGTVCGPCQSCSGGTCTNVADGTVCGTGGQCDDGRCFRAFPNCAGCGVGQFGPAANSNGVHFCTPATLAEDCAGQPCNQTGDCPVGQFCEAVTCFTSTFHCAATCPA